MSTKKTAKTKFSLSDIGLKFDELPSRDKLALTLLAVFLFAIFGLFGGYKVHESFSKQKVSFDNSVSDFFWLRSQANNIAQQSNTSAHTDIVSHVQQSIRAMGIQNPQVVKNGDGAQFSFTHHSQAVISRLLTELQNNSLTFSKIHIEQLNNDSGFRVEAIVNK